MTVMNHLTNAAIGTGIYLIANVFTRIIYKKRFEEPFFEGKKSLAVQIVSEVLSALITTVLGLYGYTLISRVSLTILAATALLIGRIDRRKMIIPNEIVLALLGIRILTLAGEFVVDKLPAKEILFDTFAGMLAATAIFLVARIFSKGSVGMGDIKLLAVVGMYVGVGTVLPLLMVTVFSSLVYSVVMIARKAISKKDTMSFAPFIAMGIVTVVLMGI